MTRRLLASSYLLPFGRRSDTQQSRKLKSMRGEPAPKLDQVRRDVADRATIVAALPRFLPSASPCCLRQVAGA
jgi:hypothetical protein